MMPEIVSTAMVGKPIAFVGDKESASWIIELLVYITMLFDVEVDNFNPDIPRRFTWCPSDQINRLEKIGYSIVNLDDKNKNMVLLPYYQELYKEIKKFPPSEAIFMYREITNEILDTIRSILIRHRKGAHYKPMMDTLPKNMYSVIAKIFKWFNPHITSNNINKLDRKIISW